MLAFGKHAKVYAMTSLSDLPFKGKRSKNDKISDNVNPRNFRDLAKVTVSSSSCFLLHFPYTYIWLFDTMTVSKFVISLTSEPLSDIDQHVYVDISKKKH